MFLKIMSDENAPDSDTRKTFRLLDHVESAQFVRSDGKPVVEASFDDGSHEQFECPGNAYLMNEAGKTVAQFGAGAIPRAA